MDDPAFRDLYDAPLHAFTAADWPGYYAAMAPWLDHASAPIRAAAAERLCIAVFRAERGYERVR